jgi:hypothetical protein
MTTKPRPVFVLRVQPLPRVDAVRALRQALKALSRQYGLRCLSVREETTDEAHDA